MPDLVDQMFELSGAVQVSPKHDCLGIPTFICHPSNSMFIPETDDRLLIQTFHAVNSDEVISTFLTPPPDVPQYYRVGEPVPIPLWLGGRATVVLSSRRWDTL